MYKYLISSMGSAALEESKIISPLSYIWWLIKTFIRKIGDDCNERLLLYEIGACLICNCFYCVNGGWEGEGGWWCRYC